MKEGTNFMPLVEKSVEQVLNDKNFLAQIHIIPVISNVSKQGELEIERRLMKKFHAAVVRRLNQKNVHKGVLTAAPLKVNSNEFVATLIVERNNGTEFDNIGKIIYRVHQMPEQSDTLELVIKIQLKDKEKQKKLMKYNLSAMLPVLHVQANKRELRNIHEPEPLLALIDFEWINCFKSVSEGKYAAPQQVSEFALLANGQVYDSGYLQVDSNIVKKIHKKLMEKQGLTMDTLKERHKEGKTMLEEYKDHLLPLLEESKSNNKALAFVYFGREDGEILKQLFPKTQWRYIYFLDFTQIYLISQLGQEAILKGLGMEFTHTFSSAMDVKALHLIVEVFKLAKTVEDTKNLQNAILVNKMISASQNPERVRIYQRLFLNHPRTKELYEEAQSIVRKYEAMNYFSSIDVTLEDA